MDGCAKTGFFYRMFRKQDFLRFLKESVMFTFE